MTEWLNRYKGTPWHRVKMFVRGVTGLFFALYLTTTLVFIFILEIGNKAWDVILGKEL